MAPAASQADEQLRTALETFETRLATPIVSGELASWTTAALAAWTALAPPVNQSLDRHREQFQQIAAEDAELLPTVQKLKDEDDAIRHEIRGLTDAVAQVARRAEQVEPHEGKLDREVEALTTRGVAFLNRVRKQEVATRAWFMEAFNRDRGVAD